MNIQEAILHKDADNISDVTVLQTEKLHSGVTEITLHFMINIREPHVLQTMRGQSKVYKSLKAAINDAWKLDRNPIVTYRSEMT